MQPEQDNGCLSYAGPALPTCLEADKISAMPLRNGQRLYYGWLIAIAGFFILYAAYGFQYSFGVFLPHIEDSLAPGQRAATSLGYSIYASLYAVLGFFSGWLTDRWGPRRVLMLGGLLLGSGIYLVGHAQTLWQYYSAYIVAALGMSTIFVPATSTIVKWFIKRRGLATGLVVLGGSVGQVTVPLISAWLLTRVEWRQAYSYSGIALAIIVVLFGLIMVREPESKGLKPFGLSEDVSQPANAQDNTSFTLREAAKTRQLWLFTGGLFLLSIMMFMPMAHLPIFAEGTLGASPAQGALMITAIGAGNCVGRGLGGWISDILGRRRMLITMVIVEVFAFLGLVLSGTVKNLTLAYGSAALFGVSYGTMALLLAALPGDLFGRRHLSAITGVIFSVSGVSTGIGIFAAGAIFERTGSYTVAFIISSALVASALPLFLLVKPPRVKGTARVKGY